MNRCARDHGTVPLSRAPILRGSSVMSHAFAVPQAQPRLSSSVKRNQVSGEITCATKCRTKCMDIFTLHRPTSSHTFRQRQPARLRRGPASGRKPTLTWLRLVHSLHRSHLPCEHLFHPSAFILPPSLVRRSLSEGGSFSLFNPILARHRACRRRTLALGPFV